MPRAQTRRAERRPHGAASAPYMRQPTREAAPFADEGSEPAADVRRAAQASPMRAGYSFTNVQAGSMSLRERVGDLLTRVGTTVYALFGGAGDVESAATAKDDFLFQRRPLPSRKSFTSRLEEGDALVPVPELHVGKHADARRLPHYLSNESPVKPGQLARGDRPPARSGGVAGSDDLRLKREPDSRAAQSPPSSSVIEERAPDRDAGLGSNRSVSLASVTTSVADARALLGPGRHSSGTILSAWRESQRQASMQRQRGLAETSRRDTSGDASSLWTGPLRFATPGEDHVPAWRVDRIDMLAKERHNLRTLDEYERILRARNSAQAREQRRLADLARGEEKPIPPQTKANPECKAATPPPALPEITHHDEQAGLSSRDEEKSEIGSKRKHPSSDILPKGVASRKLRRSNKEQPRRSRAIEPEARRPASLSPVRVPETTKPSHGSLRDFFAAFPVSVPAERRRRPGCFSALDEDLELMDEDEEPAQGKSAALDTGEKEPPPTLQPRYPLLTENEELSEFRRRRQHENQNTERSLVESDHLTKKPSHGGSNLGTVQNQSLEANGEQAPGVDRGTPTFGAPQTQPANTKLDEGGKRPFAFGSEPDKDAQSSKPAPSFGLGNAAGFSFGAAPDKEPTSAAAGKGFSFGANGDAEGSPTTGTGNGFSLRVPTDSDKSAASNDSGKATSFPGKIPASVDSGKAFSFGAGSTDKVSASGDSGTGFSFGAKTDSASGTGFSFGNKADSDKATSSDSSKEFSFGSKPDSGKQPTSSSAPGFTFGSSQADAGKPPASDSSRGFSFGSKTEPEPTTAGDKGSKGFFAADSSNGNSTKAEGAGAKGVSFGADLLNGKPANESTKGFSFGAKADAEPSGSAKPFSFGAKTDSQPSAQGSFVFGSKTESSDKPFSFGANTDANASAPSAAPFAFGSDANKASQPNGAEPAGTEAENKGGSATPSTASASWSAKSEGNLAKPAFSFGAPSEASSLGTSAPTESKPAFSFGSSSTFQFGKPAGEPLPATNDSAKPKPADGGPSFVFGGAKETTGNQSPFSFNSPAAAPAPAPAPAPAANSNGFNFSFGSNGDTMAKPMPAFTFGGGTDSKPASPGASAFGFAAGKPSDAPAFGTSTPPSTAAPQFTFGQAAASPSAFGSSSQAEQQPQSAFVTGAGFPTGGETGQPGGNGPGFQFSMGTAPNANANVPAGRKIAPMRRRRTGR